MGTFLGHFKECLVKGKIFCRSWKRQLNEPCHEQDYNLKEGLKKDGIRILILMLGEETS